MTATHRTTSARRRAGPLLAATAMAALLAPAQAAAQQVTFAQDFTTLTTTTGNNTVNISAGTALHLPVYTANTGSNTAAQDIYTKDFLAGTDVVNNNGYVFVGTESGQVISGSGVLDEVLLRDNRRYEAEMVFQNLETFNNRGSIYLGTLYETNGAGYPIGLVGTDRWHDDILSMEGTHFNGGDGSRIFIDANLNAVGQERCNAAARITEPVVNDSGSGTLPANDCINLAGGSVSGRTLVNVNKVFGDDRGAFNPQGNVVVDLTGGQAADPFAFVLDPESDGYDAAAGVIDEGLFAYALGYDADLNQFRLYGVQGAGAHQFPLLAHAATDLWRTASSGWFERQLDQRDVDRDPGIGGGFWGRVASSTIDRGVTSTSIAGANTIAFDNSYNQEDDALTFGLDLITVDGAGASWTVGGMVGYARSRVAFNQSDNTANLEGMHAGVYGGATFGGLFVDAAVNGTWLDLDNDIPTLGLLPEGTQLATKVSSLGGQVEVGWRFGRDRFGLEPLAGLTYVRTSFDDVEVLAADPGELGALVDLDDATSLRASVGARFTIDNFVPLTPNSRISLTARHGQELEGEASGSIANLGPQDASVSNALDGAFSELSAALTASNTSQTVGGYLRFGAIFGDDYDNTGFSAGVRFQW